MRLLKCGIPVIGAMTIATGLFGCADESHWGSSSNEKGSISLTLSTDSGIMTAKPVFRSEDEENADNATNLSTYCDVPSPEDFSIKLEKTTTGEVSTWSSLSSFKEHIANNTFDTGTYTLTAYYDEKGKQDFEAPYFEASTTFNVLSDQDNEVNLTAELKNSMVKINYTDGFKNYMKDYHTKIRTEGLGEPITYGTLETRPVFIEPNNATLSVHFTTKAKEITSSLSLDAFAPLAKTLHNITFDISENASAEEAILTVTFDDTLEDEDINIDLTKELLTSPAPVITCEGFENGATLDMLEGGDNISSVKMTANASDNIQSAILTIESTNYVPSWGKEIDLCKATTEQQTAIKNAGIEAIGFGFEGKETDLIATLDLTKFGTGDLQKGNHKVSLVVIDSKGKTSETASVTFDNQEITLQKIGDPSIVYASNKAELTFDYNGLNPMDDIHFYEGEVRVFPSSCIPTSGVEQTGTRASEKKRYLITLPLNNTVKSEVAIKASHKGTKDLGEFNIPVTIPEYKIEAYDAFSKYAYVKITTPGSSDPTILSAVTQNIQLKGNGTDLTISERDTQKGIVKVTGLIPSILNDDESVNKSSYLITSSIIKGTGEQENEWINWTANDGTFSTEVELRIPNSNFEGHGETYDMNGLQVGGEYRVSPVDYHHTSSFSVTLPADWATINTLTAWKESSNKNTWFIVPSSWLEDGQAKMRNVGYNHAGTTPAKSGGAFNTKYYCENAPSDSQLVHAAGEIFLGSYSFNGTESRTDGTGFSSRPAAISFYYEYQPINGDTGYAKIELLDVNGKSLGSDVFELTEGSGTKTLNFNYDKFGSKAAKLIVSFKSSNSSTPPINIPSGDSLNESVGLGNKTIGTNEYHAVATGSILKIDNVKAVYGDGTDTPANAPKKSTKKRR